MPPIIELRNISKEYLLGGPVRQQETFRELLIRTFQAPWSAKGTESKRSFWALRDVSFDVNSGDVIGIIGRNGAGKSTLLKILSRITDPTAGSVHIRGRLASLLEVGTGFHPELTGRENIFLNGAILGMRKAEIASKFDEIVAFSEVEKFLDTPVKRYSSGMYVRLAFSVAAHLNPEILIVDEVLAVGDVAFQKKCLGKMGEVSRSGRTVLFVSHNMAAIENLCTRAVILHEGKLQFDGTTKDGIQHYLNSLSTRSGRGSVIDLDGVGTRRSPVAPLLKRMEFFTDNEQPLGEGIPIGAKLKAKVHFDLPTPVDKVHVGLGFDNMHGQRVFTAHSIFQPDLSIGTRVGPQVYTCEIPSFALVPGEYSVKVWLDLKRGQADTVEDAAKITVLESDYYGTGRVPWNGMFVLKHRWYLEQVANAK
jgi:lipopolysaccharide transport system ATP-binding protein